MSGPNGRGVVPLFAAVPLPGPQAAAGALRLDPPRTLCLRHIEPLKAEWPRGYAEATSRLLELALAVPALIQAADGDIANLPTVFEKMPLCGWLPDRLVEEVIRAAIDGAPPAQADGRDRELKVNIDAGGSVNAVNLQEGEPEHGEGRES